MKRIWPALILGACLVSELFLPAVVRANAPALQVSPLLYEDTLSAKPKSGHIDVSNPTDAPVVVDVGVRGFRQVGSHGDLEFFDSPDLASAIQTDLHQFQMGPRDAIRVLFTVEPSKLPPGSVSAAIFFTTHPAEQSANSSYVTQSANIGTLLVLRNGTGTVLKGGISKLSLPLWQFGSGISGSASVANASETPGGVAFHPGLSTQVLWGHRVKQEAGLVLPGVTRDFLFTRPGSFFGILPVKVAEEVTGTSRTGWVIVCTGWYGWLLLVLALALLALGGLRAGRRLRGRRVPAVVEPPTPDPAAVSAPVSPETNVEPEPGSLPPEPDPEAVPEPEPKSVTQPQQPEELPAEPASNEVRVRPKSKKRKPRQLG